jgi:4-amino-4-deoxy-L-arabinose transferase-like glycosyltransferase
MRRKKVVLLNKLSLLFFASLIINTLFVLFIVPPVFIFDEGSYAQMVIELASDPLKIIPTITGEPVGYKPPLFTWIQLPFYYILQLLPLSSETIVRLPSTLFGALSVVLIFLIAKRLYTEKIGLIAALLFLTSPMLLFSSSVAMMESFSIFLILASIYFYLKEEITTGSIFLGLIILTKWLYVLAPILFVSLFFLNKPKFQKVLLSFISIPIFLGFYLVISWLFCSFDNAIYNLVSDLFRAQPIPSLMYFFINLFFLMVYTFPLSIFFLFFVLSERSDLWKEKHLIGMGLLIFLTLFSNKFIPWYSSISFPAMVLFVSLQVSKDAKLMRPILVALIIINCLSISFFPMNYQDIEVKDIAIFSKGKNVTFFMTQPIHHAWTHISEHYRGTNKSYLPLEQFNSGLLYYRFNDTKDYENIHAVYSYFNESPGCDDYLVVDSNETVPDCYTLLWNTSRYWVYSTKE